MMVKSFLSLSVTSLGAVSVAATATNSPKCPFFPEPSCEIMPLETVNSDAGTFQVCAAAATKTNLAVAPAFRKRSQLCGIAPDPPVSWRSNFSGSRLACATLTFAQSASNSSATTIGKEVLMF